MKNKKHARSLSLLLCAGLLFGQVPVTAAAETMTPEDGAIVSFQPLDSRVKRQTVPLGTEESELNLPDGLTVTVYNVTEEPVISDDEIEYDEADDTLTASPSDARSGASGKHAGDDEEIVTTVTKSKEKIQVTWDSSPVYDGNTPDNYVFTADVDRYTLSDGVEPPIIIVTVADGTVESEAEIQQEEPIPCTETEGCMLPDGHEGECVLPPVADNGLAKTIISWTFVDDDNLNGGELHMTGVSADNQAGFDMVVSMLPTQVSAVIDKEQTPQTLDIIRWDCPEYAKTDGDSWPVSGGYTFTAALQSGYSCNPLPAVQVIMGGGLLLDDSNHEWDGQSDSSASSLGASAGDTITITGGNGSSHITIDVDNITVTSNNNYSIGYIDVDQNVTTLTIKDLNLTLTRINNSKGGIAFTSDATLKAEGSCNIYGVDGPRATVISSLADLTLEVDNGASLTVTGTNGINRKYITSGDLTVNVGQSGNLTVRGAQLEGVAVYADDITINNDGIVLAECMKGTNNFRGTGIYSLGNMILSGSGTITAKGSFGIHSGKNLDVNTSVYAEGPHAAIILDNMDQNDSSKLTGSGELTAKITGNTDETTECWGIGIRASLNMELAFDGKLTVHGGSGTEGHGFWAGYYLTVTKCPETMDVQAGTKSYSSAFFAYTLVNRTDMDIIIGHKVPFIWPDIVPPRVTNIWPDGSSNGSMKIEFSETMKTDPGTVTLTDRDRTITLTGGHWDIPYWDFYGQSMFVIEYAGLKSGATYTINISGFQDKAGNVMDADSSHVFTTPGMDSGGGGGSGSITTVPTIKWILDEKGWRLKNPDQTWATNSWKEVNGIWYHFNEEGYMQTGWYTDIDGNRYYLSPADGSPQGSMVTGWQLIDDRWYYFNMESDGTKGRLLYNTVTPDGYYVNGKGEWMQ